MIFVHHGLFWKKMWPLSFTGTMYNRISYLIQNDLALYAVHLPLDVHPELGNNAQICNKLGLVDIQPFGYYKGLAYGYKGRLTKTTKRDDIIPLICSQPEECQKILPFGRPEINTVGVVSGGMADAVREAITSGLDLFITGTAEHQVYHECLENNINVIFGGHYLTEIWGVKAVANYLKTNTDLETIFLDIPTGL
jgi:dinuclear metal center YbgI/SA1388 family protein